jgi:scyllo-inositol 2-dehydrogenase (NADP+)
MRCALASAWLIRVAKVGATALPCRRMDTELSRKKIRVALLGYGLGGACFHAPLIAATAGMRLATVVTRDAGRRAQALREHPGVRVLESADQLWACAHEHELAVISTTNRTHASLALAALRSGLPVVIDKPFARSAAEGREILAVARQLGLLLSAYHIRRWDSETLTVRGLLERAALGRVLRFESRLERWRPQPKGGWREQADPEEAGGLLFDLGSHLIDQALYLFGSVTHVYAELDKRRPRIAVDDDVFLALTHANGVRSHLWASATAAHFGARMRMLGDKAAYVKQHADLQEAALRAGRRPDQPGWCEELETHWGVLSTGDEQRPVPSVAGAYQDYYAQILRSLRTGAPPPVSAEDAITGLEILAAAQCSARERCVVTL